ncbi:MAG: terpene synthase family protein [Pseudonocardiaceae bacterium]
MYSFELPDFYMPFAARLNPHLDAAREHAKAWAREMGMLGSHDDLFDFFVWDEAEFDSFDFAFFASSVHPDAPTTALDLVTDWYVWGFFLDDAFVEAFKRGRQLGSQDLAVAKVALSRFAAFMPADSALTPAPTNLVERALADLWSRTAPTMSADWRWQFSVSMRSFFEGCLWELVNISEHRIPDPIDYVEMRRKAGATELSADLARSAVCLEIPPEVFMARPMRTLTAAFCDWVSLSNDIFSYQREIELEREINNGVLVFERFFDCNVQHAVDVVNGLVTARLRQFEDTVAMELPIFFGEFGLDTNARKKVMAYVDGLQDWMAGDLQWHLRSSRYTNLGLPDFFSAHAAVEQSEWLGTAAAVIGPSQVPVAAATSHGLRDFCSAAGDDVGAAGLAAKGGYQRHDRY